VGPGDVADFVMHREYVLFANSPDQAPRKRLLGLLADGVFHNVLAGGHPTATLNAVYAAAQSGHLLLWSSRVPEQAVLQAGLLGGALPTGDSPYLEVLTQNVGGDKLDYYLRRRVRVTRVPDGRLRVELQLHSVVPAGLPTYMTVRSDKPMPPVPVGQAKLAVSVYGAKSTRFDQVQRDGKTSTMVSTPTMASPSAPCCSSCLPGRRAPCRCWYPSHGGAWTTGSSRWPTRTRWRSRCRTG